MTEVEKCFLEAYHCSLLKDDYKKLNHTVNRLSKRELQQVLTLAENHLIFPMVYEAVILSSPEVEDNTYMQRRLDKAVKITCDQARRTAEFLKLILFLAERGLYPIIMKGIICRSLYPQPEQRPSTDEDLLISSSQFDQYYSAFTEYGLNLVNKEADIENEHEVSFCSSKIYIELHKSPFPPESLAYGDLNRYFKDADKVKTSIDVYGVPVTTLNPTDHVFYLLCHAYKHFLNCGIGIRLVSDIVLYSVHYENYIDWEKVKDQCCEINAFDFVSALYCIGEKHLLTGQFPDSLRMIWNTDEVDESLLLNDILVGGIYGSSSEERLHSANITLGSVEAEKTGKALSVAKRTMFPPKTVLQNRYPYLKNKPFLIPVAWSQRLFSYISDNLIHKRNASGVSEAVRIGNERVAIMRRYRMIDGNNSSLLKRIYKRSQTSVLAPVISPVFLAVCSIEYAALNAIWFLKGNRRPDESEQKIVKDNVTFIFKSFERQKMVRGLCRNISRLYPGTKMIIADDSSKPLDIRMPDVSVINLPYNSGLGAGLNAALEKVETPYVVRLDDDELLTIRSSVHTELEYLMAHEELDLIGFGHMTAIRLHSPQFNFREYYKCPMNDAPLPLKIPHLTKIDENHVVLGKVANIYLARTNKMREVGFDPEIKVIDHHEFFWRAAGIMTSAVALDTVVFHRHDPYNRNYNLHRSDYSADLKYIKRKKSDMLRGQRNENKKD